MKLRTALLIAFSLITFSRSLAQQLNWEQVNPPEGGRVNVVEVNSSGCLFAGIVGGAFYSKDNGEHWERLQGIDFTIDRIVTHNSGSVLLYSKGGNVYHVNNNLIVSKTNYGFISAQVDSKGKIYGFTSSTVYVSLDGGINWSFFASLKSGFNSVAISNDNIIIAVNDKEIQYSTDLGKSWNKSDYIFTTRTYAPDLVMKVDSKGNLFLKDYIGIFKSTDSGRTWLKINAPFESNYINCLSVTAKDELLVSSNVVLWESIDAGTTWTKVGSLNDSPENILKLTTTDYKYSAFLGVHSYNGITKKDELNNKGLFAKQISGLEYFDGLFIGAGYDGCYYSDINFPVWKKINVS
ncbi:MAG: sialidase family protein, partial [Ignavibacteria bacterium]|nr:sialidase family protein [Ignavibacteria bacterium]